MTEVPAMRQICLTMATLLAFLACTAVVGHSMAGDLMWQQAYGGSGIDEGQSLARTSDGGYAIAGTTDSFGNGKQAYLIKTDADGATDWQNNYGGGGDEYGNSVLQASDGGYIVAGTTGSVANGSKAFLLKTAADGAVEWQNSYGGNGNDSGASVKQTADGGYIIAGTTDSFGNGEQVYLVKTSADGNMEWQNNYGGSGDDYGNSVQPTADGGYIVSGTTQVDKANYTHLVYVVKTDANGALVWQKTFGETDGQYYYNVGNSVIQASDGSYIIAGSTVLEGYDKVYLAKISEEGALIWQHHYLEQIESDGGFGNSVQQTADGGYIIAMQTWLESGNVGLVKTSADGALEWMKGYSGGTSGDDAGNAVVVTDGGDYVVAGTKLESGNGAQVYLARIAGNTTRIFVAHFTSSATAGLAPLTVQFNDTSVGSPASWQWNFGDGTANVTTQNVTHRFDGPGNYTVTMTVADGPLTSTATEQITVINLTIIPPVAGFTPSALEGAAPFTIQLLDTSTGDPATWNWSFGDGSPNVTLKNSFHTYDSPGNYTVTLTAANGSFSSTASAQITVYRQVLGPVVTDKAWLGKNGTINFSYSIASAAKDVRLYVYDEGGRLVNSSDAGNQKGGSHAIAWSGLDTSLARVPDGNYTLKLYVYYDTNAGAYPDIYEKRMASFNRVGGMAVDSAGDIYVSETYDGDVKEIYPDGTVVARGVNFSYPEGLAADTHGIIYVAESGTGAIKRIYPNGTIDTFGAGIPSVTGVAVDDRDNVYGMGPSSVVQAYANGTLRALLDYHNVNDILELKGLTIGSDGMIYVTNAYHNPDLSFGIIYRIDPRKSPPTISVIYSGSDENVPDGPFGTDNPYFLYPFGLAADGQGRIFVLNQRSATIDVINIGPISSSGDRSPFSAYQLDSPGSVAVDSNGDLYVIDGNAIDEFVPPEGYPMASGPVDIALDSIAPVTLCNLSGTSGNGASNGGTLVTLNASDNGSGVNETLYSLDDGTWSIYGDPLNVTVSGNHTISYYSIDRAGNLEAANTTTFDVTSGGHETRILVDPRPGIGMFTNISSALAYASPGDIIVVNSGYYRERLVVNKAIMLAGQNVGIGMPVLDGYNGQAAVLSASGVSMSGFNVTNSSTGIYAYSGDNIRGNKVSGNGNGIFLYGSGNNVSGNTARGNNVGIYLYRSEDNRVANNDASDNRFAGVYVLNSYQGNEISGNEVDGGQFGIFSYNSGGNRLSGNTANGDHYGIYLFNASDDLISHNTANGSSVGIYVIGGRNNITENTIGENYVGLCLSTGSADNNASGNIVSDNTYGIYVYNSNGNRLWLNVLGDNSKNAYVNGGTSYWNSPVVLQYIFGGQEYRGFIGNYWGDYRGGDANNDGIGDTPYRVSADNIDQYPMLEGASAVSGENENLAQEQDTAPYSTFIGTRGVAIN